MFGYGDNFRRSLFGLSEIDEAINNNDTVQNIEETAILNPFEGTLVVNNGTVQASEAPVVGDDLTNKNYVDNQDNLKLDKTGGTIDPASATATSLFIYNTVPRTSGFDLNILNNSANGNALRIVNGNQTSGTVALIQGQVNQQALLINQGDLKISTGNVIVSTPPTIGNHLTNKTYVDNKLDKTGGELTGNLDLTGTAKYQIDGEDIHHIIDKGNNNFISIDNNSNTITGADNIGIGNQNVLSAITTQNRNIAIGNSAMGNHTGSFNVVVGWGGLPNGSGEANSILGDACMRNATTAGGCVAIGCGSLFYNESGNDNIAIGCFSGEEITTQSDNILIGKDTRTFPYSSCIVLGKSARSTQSNQFIVGTLINEFVCQADSQMNLGSPAKKMANLYMNGVIDGATQINGLTPQGGVYSSTSSATTVEGGVQGTTETTIVPPSGVGSLSVPADGFSVGDVYHLVLAGSIGSANGQSIILRLKSASVILGEISYTFPVAVSSATSFFEIEVDFQIISTGIGGSAEIRSNFDFTFNKPPVNAGFEGGRVLYTQGSGFNTTISNTLDITAEWGSTNASNEITTQMMYLRKQY
jgi:hypothetical protein